jgi:excisionase family DNA binding protein
MNNPFETIDARLSNIENLLLDLKHPLKAQSNLPEPDLLLTIKQAAVLLSLSVSTLYLYVQRAEIPVSKRGKRLYFSQQELTDWVKAGRKKTLAEINLEANSYINKKGLKYGK